MYDGLTKCHRKVEHSRKISMIGQQHHRLNMCEQLLFEWQIKYFTDEWVAYFKRTTHQREGLQCQNRHDVTQSSFVRCAKFTKSLPVQKRSDVYVSGVYLIQRYHLAVYVWRCLWNAFKTWHLDFVRCSRRNEK